MADAESANVPERQSVQMAVSNEMVRIYKTQFGRGPTKTRTDFAGPDVLVCTLRDSFTAVERNMLAMGEHLRVGELRHFFQRAAEVEFRQEVERITGRKVSAFVSGTDTEQDVSTEVFYLEPSPNRVARGVESTEDGR
jgi:uncharacterized protein YbcI